MVFLGILDGMYCEYLQMESKELRTLPEGAFIIIILQCSANIVRVSEAAIAILKGGEFMMRLHYML